MFSLTLLAWLLFCGAVLGVEVDLELGRIRGANLTSRLGVPFHAFRGIPYAEPPLGELRFRNPVPVTAWAPATFDATQDGPKCPQVFNTTRDILEDCLRINVYTKNLSEDARLPVIVFIHPGSFHVLSGQSNYIAGPEHFMDRDCVLVTFNYRLGSLGFLATGSEDAPGNAGLKDQVLALRWVQQHIHRFGGNSQSVTLLGSSVGSMSIGLHMLSPMSRSLFHRGICMSSSPYGQWAYETEGVHIAQRQARLLKCPEKPVKDLVNCLRGKHISEFMNSHRDMFELDTHPQLLWRPVIEPDFGQERFLLEHPYKTAQSGDFYKVPLITGITEFEFLRQAYSDLYADSILDKLNSNWEHFAPIILLYERDTPRSKNISAVLRKAYLGNGRIEYPKSMKCLGRLYSDALIGIAYNRFMRLMAPYTPIYTYYFRYKGRYSFFDDLNPKFSGAVHLDELIYLFHVGIMMPLSSASDPEHLIIERLTRMWTEFALKGDPNNASDEYLRDLHWPPYNPTDQNYLEIGENLTTKSGNMNEKCFKLWDDLFPFPTF